MKRKITSEQIYLSIQKQYPQLEQDVFLYGFGLLIRYGLYLLFLVILAGWLNLWVPVFSFVIPFMVLRHYTGGIHVPNDCLCLILTLIVTLGLPWLAMYIPVPSFFVLLFLYIAPIGVIRVLGIHDHPNKPLSSAEIQWYTHKAVCTEFFYLIIGLILYECGIFIGSMEILCACWICTLETVFLTLWRSL